VPNLGRAWPPPRWPATRSNSARTEARRGWAAPLAQKRHSAADAFRPHAVDKPPHVGRPGSRRPGQDEARGDKFAWAVLALIAIGSPAAVAKSQCQALQSVARCLLDVRHCLIMNSRVIQRFARSSAALLAARTSCDRPRGHYDSERLPTAAGDTAARLLRVRCPAGGPIDRSYSASGTP
jgi:hypothetical protein